jgi:FKBP-type peptidyl-prolyl isomerase-like protein
VKYGIDVIGDQPGTGPLVERGATYRVRLKMWLRRGDPVRWNRAPGDTSNELVEDEGATITANLRMDRSVLIPGVFYGMEGMRVGGIRTLRIPPPWAYGESGIPGLVPPNAVITAEVAVLGIPGETRAPGSDGKQEATSDGPQAPDPQH